MGGRRSPVKDKSDDPFDLGPVRGHDTPGVRREAVTVQPFCMDVTEVTVDAYGACVAAHACTEPDPFVSADAPSWEPACNWGRPGAGRHPVNCVDWGQATAYCAWAGKRLPTEEEWEWGARSTTEGRTYPWGEQAPSADRLNACGIECVVWLKGKGGGARLPPMYPASDGWPRTAPVGSFPRGATRQGLKDMAGNVWEWTSSLPVPGSRQRVVRGGGWRYDVATSMRAAERHWDLPSTRDDARGFRCAR
jgi:formylglycine-generating enzyme required for sulfatase activity